jgi:hypothetical protein
MDSNPQSTASCQAFSRFLSLLFALVTGMPSLSAHAANFESVTAVFSSSQALWPELDQKSDGAKNDSFHLIVLPPPPPILDESPPCDSCDRLSPNVLEFFLPNWHRDLFAKWLPNPSHVEVLTGGHPLLLGDSTFTQANPTLPALPYSAWFAEPAPTEPQVIYRPRDRFMPDSARRLLSRLGGRLKATHLLVIDSVHVRLRPWTRSSDRGSFRLGYCLMLFNVASGQPEWVMRHSLKGRWWSDLDQPLEPRLEPAYVAWKRDIPEALKRLWAAEPR